MRLQIRQEKNQSQEEKEKSKEEIVIGLEACPAKAGSEAYSYPPS
jgi:hypothetical protein